jgi:hypothetical protein
MGQQEHAGEEPAGSQPVHPEKISQRLGRLERSLRQPFIGGFSLVAPAFGVRRFISALGQSGAETTHSKR